MKVLGNARPESAPRVGTGGAGRQIGDGALEHHAPAERQQAADDAARQTAAEHVTDAGRDRDRDVRLPAQLIARDRLEPVRQLADAAAELGEVGAQTTRGSVTGRPSDARARARCRNLRSDLCPLVWAWRPSTANDAAEHEAGGERHRDHRQRLRSRHRPYAAVDRFDLGAKRLELIAPVQFASPYALTSALRSLFLPVGGCVPGCPASIRPARR